ncbi:GFA family protein [Acidisoma sp.]|uniref:GFA family protein n=1 Tax=Acidisoma sp. TaxID=1872115 RepID=UPI003AFFFB69
MAEAVRVAAALHATNRERGFPLPQPGGCRCGRVRYRVTEAPVFTLACHCTDCQHLSASAFSLGMVVPRGGHVITDGRDALRCWSKTGGSGKESRQFTCAACATWLYTEADSAAAFTIVRPGSLDDHRWFRPIAQIFTRSALPWALKQLQFSYETEFDDPGPIRQAFASSGIRPGA